MAATIKDIAKKTGLGGATISAYLNGVKIRPTNKDAIEKAIKELGYVRNEYARGLKTRRTMTIGVLIPELCNVFSTTIISEMEDILRGRGYGIIVCDCRSNSATEKQSLEFLLSKMVDGLIIMPITADGKILASAVDMNIPLVVIDRMTDRSEASYVVINNREIAFEAAENLMEKGHKRVALISGSRDIYTAYERREGYRLAAEKYDVYDESLVYDGGLTVEGGYATMKNIIENKMDITGVFVTNYEMTIGAIIAINEFGKNIPNDFSFVGFDNQELSKIFTPKLATVNQPLTDIGRTAAEQIIALINGGKPEIFVLPATFIEGGSVKKI